MPGYPQFVSEEYWGVTDKFLHHIDEIIYGGNNNIFFISGDKLCVLKFENNKFQLVKEYDNYKELIKIPNENNNSNFPKTFQKIECGFL